MLGGVSAATLAVSILYAPPAGALVLGDNFDGNGFTVIDTASRGPLATGIDSSNVFNNVVSLDGGNCTGTLINFRTVLTAAHCFFNSAHQFTPITSVGFTPTGSAVASTKVTPGLVVINPGYSAPGTSAADIAVVILPTPVNTITPANLLTLSPGGAGFPDKAAPLLLTGFGLHGKGSDPPPANELDNDNKRRIAQTTLGGYVDLTSLPGASGAQKVFAAQFRDPANPAKYNFFNFTTGQAQVTTAEGGNAPGDSGGGVFYCPTGSGCTPSQLVLIGTLIGGNQPPATPAGQSNGYGEVNWWTPVNLFLPWIDGNNGELSIEAKAGTANWTSTAAWTGAAVPGTNDVAWLSNATTMTVDANSNVGALWVGNSAALLTIPASKTLTVGDAGTTISSGQIAVAGTLATPLLGMTGGVLSGTGTINTLSGGSLGAVSNYAGVVKPGTASATGTLTITGDYEQGASGTLLIKAGTVSADKLVVSRDALLDGTLQVQAVQQGSLIDRTGVTRTVLSASAIDKTFANFPGGQTMPLSAFIGGKATYSATDVNVLISRTNDYVTAANSKNTMSFAQVLDQARGLSSLSSDFKTILGLLDTATADEAKNFFSSAVADGNDDSSNVTGNQLLANLATARMVQGAIDQHLTMLRDDTATLVYGAAGQKNLEMAYASGGSLGIVTSPGQADATVSMTSNARNGYAAGPTPARSAAWLRVLGGWQNLHGDGNALGLKQNVTGLIGGFDVNPFFETLPDLKSGVAASYTRGKLGGGSESGTTEAYRVSVYGTQPLGRAYIDGQLTYGGVRMSTTRNIDLFGTPLMASGSAGGTEWSGSLNVGVRQMLGRILVEPFAGLSYIRVTRNGYAESGSGALNLIYQDSKLESQRFSAGARAQTAVPFSNGLVLRPELRARYSYDAKDVMPTTTATLEGLPGLPFSFDGVQLGRHAAVLGAGLTLAKGKTFSLFADYNVEMRRYETVQTAWGGLRMSW